MLQTERWLTLDDEREDKLSVSSSERRCSGCLGVARLPTFMASMARAVFKATPIRLFAAVRSKNEVGKDKRKT
jgi:hypothetical protein